MAEINPNILLNFRTADLSGAFDNMLTNIQKGRERRKQEALAAELKPMQDRMMAAQVGTAEAGLTQQEQANLQQQRQNKMANQVQNAFRLDGFLTSGDTEGAKQFLQGQIDAGNQAAGSALELLKTNPEMLSQRVKQTVGFGKQAGLLGQRLTPRQQELAQFQALPETTPQEKAFKNQFGQAIGAIAKRAGIEEKVQTQQEVGDIKTQQAINKAKGLEGTEQGIQQTQLNKIKIDESKIKNEESKNQAINTKNIRKKEADNAVFLIGDLLADDEFSAAFGKVVTATPEMLRTQSAIDARAKVDQIISLLSLESRQKLKGQGTITDSEAKTLEQSATLLANPKIGDSLVRRELRRVRNIFEDASERNRLKNPISTTGSVENLNIQVEY